MAAYGYARVSTIDQDLPLQRQALRAAGCSVVRAEKASGSRRDGRTELQVLLDFMQSGDTLVVTRIDRLARSLKDLQDIVHELKSRGVALRATEQPVAVESLSTRSFVHGAAMGHEDSPPRRREGRAVKGSAYSAPLR
jgi:DNA invertase Pin-like site-specific DNA recombinase